MDFSASLLWKVLLATYPDAVDVQAVSQKIVVETTIDAPSSTEWDEDSAHRGSVRTMGQEFPNISESTIYLKEIEPETGIYTAMSEKTHRVYVYVDLEEHGIV